MIRERFRTCLHGEVGRMAQFKKSFAWHRIGRAGSRLSGLTGGVASLVPLPVRSRAAEEPGFSFVTIARCRAGRFMAGSLADNSPIAFTNHTGCAERAPGYAMPPRETRCVRDPFREVFCREVSNPWR